MSLRHRVPRTGTRGYAHLVEVGVPTARVWRALTEPRLLRIWTAQEVLVDPRKGGLYRFGNPQAHGREAHIDVFEANRRLRLIYQPGRGDPPSDSALVDDFLLDQRRGEGSTSLRLLGSGVPESEAWDAHYLRLRVGWERCMARIKVLLESPPRPKARPAQPRDPPLVGFDD